MENVSFAARRLAVCGNKIICLAVLFLNFNFLVWAQEIKQPNVAGSFYPADSRELASMIDNFLDNANPRAPKGSIFGIIVPHAGLGFSGQTAAFGYKLIKDKAYKTVIILAPSHYYPFSGVSVYKQGKFNTPLGSVEIDSDFTQKLLDKDKDIIFDQEAFAKEHSVEVEVVFLQRVLKDFKIVPVVMGDCDLTVCQKFADMLKEIILDRNDVLIVVSTDMYHGYDYDEADVIDGLTLEYLKNMDSRGLYYGLREGKLQLCGGFPAVTAILLSKSLGHEKLDVLDHTNSAVVTGKKVKGNWTVGYSSCVIDKPESEDKNMLSVEQKKKLLDIARSSLEHYLKTGKKLPLEETDPVLQKEMGAFVTLNENHDLRGCIGNIVGRQPLYLTVRDMAVESGIGDPRFSQVKLSELKDIEFEISVLSPLEKIDSVDKIEMGKHGVLVKKGFNSGVFLPQVATDTGWTKEEFLSNLCSQKAGLKSDAWKNKDTEIYIFTAEVFSENDFK